MSLNQCRFFKLLAITLLSLLFATLLPAGGAKTEDGVHLFENHKYAEAKSSLEAAIREDAKDARAANYLGRILLITGDLDRAVEWMEKAVAIEGQSSECHLWLGRAYGQKAVKASLLKQASLAGKVKKEFERASELDPDNLDARFGLIDFYLQAPGIMGGSVAKAKEQAQEIRKRDALRGYRAAGRVAEYEKEFDKALEEYERAAKEYPQKTEPVFWIGSFYAQRKQYAKAFEVYEKFLEKQPLELTACYQIGRVALLSGERLDRGEECFKLYLQSEPKKDEPPLAWAHYRLGMLYEKKGNRDLAKREYQNALRIDPTHHDAKEALKKLS